MKCLLLMFCRSLAGEELETKTVSNSDVQTQILEILANEADHSYYGVHRTVMFKKLNVSEKAIDFNLAYLKNKGFVKLVEAPNCSWLWAKITSHGLNHIELVANELASTQHISDAFQSAHELTEKQIHISETRRNAIVENLNVLEKELTSKESDAGRIQELCRWLGENANWTKPVLHKTVVEVIKQNLF
jgi:hypothetical protein